MSVINIGEVYCGRCGDPFEPDGIPYQDEPNFCSEGCEESYEDQRSADQAYWEARHGGAPVY